MFTWWAMWPMSCTIKDVATARQWEMPRGMVGLRLILGVYSPLSIAAMPASIAVWFEMGHGPLGQVAALA
jgi:hypothetical protein